MNTKSAKLLNKAIEEAIKFGFNSRFVYKHGAIRSLLTKEGFSDSEFVVVKSYPVFSDRGYKGTISYIVLNDGKLGFFLKEAKNSVINTATLEDEFESVSAILEENE